MDNTNRIKIIDSPCGFGKTTYAIQHINELPEDTKIIYITPFLKECDRIKASCPAKNFYAPDSRKGQGSKMNNMIDLILKGRNVVSTHALFGNIDDRLINAIRNNNYILILDEVMNVVEKFDLYNEDFRKTENEKENWTRGDIKILAEKNIIEIDSEHGCIKWIASDQILNKYIQLKNLCDRQMLHLVDNDLLVWSFPTEVFKEGIFDEIFILTYQFDNQIQAYYYNYFEIPYTVYGVTKTAKKKYELIKKEDAINHEEEWKKEIKKLISVCDNPKLNKIGSYYVNSSNITTTTSLSKNWFEFADKETIKTLNSNIINYFQNQQKSKSSQRMWTCFKAHKNIMKEKNLSTKNWIELNARATNDYAHKTVLAYPINRYLNPFFIKFFSKRNIKLDQDKFALSELIQWIFRSAIRNNQKISIYIPSQRMRELFLSWLNS